MIKKIKDIFDIIRSDYRHYIALSISALFLGFGFLFPNAIPRLAETIRDVLTSFVYYLADFAELEYLVPATVTSFQKWKFGEEIWKPVRFLPHTFDEFITFWSNYWKLVFNKENFLSFYYSLSDFFYYGSKILMIIAPLGLMAFIIFDSYKSEECTDRYKKSKELVQFQKIQFNYIYPVSLWIKDFIGFVSYYPYLKIWVILWLLYFNVFSIVLAFLAYYLYFVSSWDFLSIYIQLLKLQTDITPVIRFIPGIVWLALGVWLFNRYCNNIADEQLNNAERANRAFLRQRGVSIVVCGPMRVGKTQFITSLAVATEDEFFDNADETMTDKETMFPNFPWQIFRDYIARNIRIRRIVDLFSCRKWVQDCRRYFDIAIEKFTAEELMQRNVSEAMTFGYDYDHFSFLYDNELKLVHLYEALEDYACAYMIYTIETTLIFSNYSIRVDHFLEDRGNMPRRNKDHIHRTPYDQVLMSKHAHLIEYDMLRLGEMMIKDNPRARRLSYGCYVISEIDKERKNTLELKEVKSNTDECNQKNDMFNANIMMSGHANVVDYKTYIRYLSDLQRPDAWGAGGRELGEVIEIVSKDELVPALPFFSPYWLTEGIFRLIQGAWNSWYRTYKENRSDLTLFVYLVNNLISAIDHYYVKVLNRYGIQTFNLVIQSGLLESTFIHDKWRNIIKIARANRYATDCLEGVFQSDKPNTMHIDDYTMYKFVRATPEELMSQHSFFQNDIRKMKGNKKDDKK